MAIAPNNRILYSDLPKINNEVHLASCTPVTVTLTVGGWTNNKQTVNNIAGMTSTMNVIVTPNPETAEAFFLRGIIAESQGTGSLTFRCAITPEEVIKVNILMIATT